MRSSPLEVSGSYDSVRCTVRGCRLPFTREGQRLVCGNGHAFDIARSGYVNLLQPQERRSKDPGDSAEAATARRRIHDRGITRPLLDAIAAMLDVDRHRENAGMVVDAGCGDGWYLGELQRTHGFNACGIDISTPAIELAAKRYPDCTWLVANADRFVPLADASATTLLSVTARMNAAEFRRVLRDDGTLLVAVAAPDDLIELRGEGKDRVAKAVETFAGEFTLTGQRRATSVATVDESIVRDLRLSIYRPRGEMTLPRVTLSLDLLLFAVP